MCINTCTFIVYIFDTMTLCRRYLVGKKPVLIYNMLKVIFNLPLSPSFHPFLQKKTLEIFGNSRYSYCSSDYCHY